MNIFQKMLRMSGKKSKSVGDYAIYNEVEARHRSGSGSWTFDWAKGNAYDNIYPSITKIANAFMNIRPYAIDANGKPVQDVNALNRIYHPNQRMSATDFREALAVCSLVHRKVFLLVWHIENGKVIAGAGENLTEENIGGFSFLEDAVVVFKDGRKYYKSETYKWEFTENDVIEISSGIDPYDLNSGYSPTQAVKKWANIDDFAADYEGGLLENNAVPAGQFTITAGTVEQFDAIVDEMQRRHRGAGNNNAVQYVHRPVDSTTGAPLTAQIEWTPFSQSNQSLDLATIFKQANDKIDSTFGVPSSIRGVNENKGYASVRIDEQVFIKYTVKPFATRIWTKMTHELNRITGGLGYAITFDLEIPNIAEEEKVIAETKKIELDLITTALDRGYSLDSIVDAFELSNSYKLLAKGSDEDATIENDKPEVDEGGEVEDSPEVAVVKSYKLCCAHDHEPVISKSADEKTLKSLRQILNKFFETEIEDVVESLGTAQKNISAVGLEQYDENGDGEIDILEAEQIQIPEPDEQKRYALTLALMAVLLSRMKQTGEKRYQETIAQFGLTISIPELQHYTISNATEEYYQNIVSKISNSFSDQITSCIKGAINQTIANGDGKTTVKDVIKNVQNTLKSEDWRVERIARTEEHRADNLGQVDAVKELAQVTGREFGFKWLTQSDNPCEFCKSMDGTVVATGEAFVPLGEKIELESGGQYINTYGDMLTPNAHPNCQCIFKVVEL